MGDSPKHFQFSLTEERQRTVKWPESLLVRALTDVNEPRFTESDTDGTTELIVAVTDSAPKAKELDEVVKRGRVPKDQYYWFLVGEDENVRGKYGVVFRPAQVVPVPDFSVSRIQALTHNVLNGLNAAGG